jgi:hypothetical protein
MDQSVFQPQACMDQHAWIITHWGDMMAPNCARQVTSNERRAMNSVCVHVYVWRYATEPACSGPYPSTLLKQNQS